MSLSENIQELLPGFFRVEVPLPENPLKALNAYVACGQERCLLIDNGFNMPEAEEVLRRALHSLDVDLARTDFFLTHMHSDHCGLTMKLRSSSSSKIFISAVDGTRLNEGITDSRHWEGFLDLLREHGFPAQELDNLREAHPGKKFACEEPVPFTPVEEGLALTYGSCRFRVLSVPGHTPGHLALLEEKSGALVAGDHILAHITPNITHWSGVDDSLGDYLQSLETIRYMAVGRCFPGHRQMVDNTHERIDQLLAHHSKRLQEVSHILQGNSAENTLCAAPLAAPLSAYDVAARMRWALRGQWQDFRVQQRCFATGEALAHLFHLVRTGRAQHQETEHAGRVVRYFLPCQTTDCYAGHEYLHQTQSGQVQSGEAQSGQRQTGQNKSCQSTSAQSPSTKAQAIQGESSCRP